jgi:hypothetical protein
VRGRPSAPLAFRVVVHEGLGWPSKAMGRQGRRNGTGRRRGASRATTGDVVCLGVPVLRANGRGLNGLGPSFGRVVFVQTGAKIDGAAWLA